MPGRSRRGIRPPEEVAEDGPFVSFTDLFIGILFLFLILVAALMLMHQEAVTKAKQEMQAYAGITPQQAQQMQSKLEAAAQLDAQHPPFRLALVYNEYQSEEDLVTKLAQAAGAEQQWTFARTMRIFRDPTGLCINNILLENPHLVSTWQPAIDEKDIPTSDDQQTIRGMGYCLLTASGAHWTTSTETTDMVRTAPDLYTGKSVLHTSGGDTVLDIQYRILGIYDDFFAQPSPPVGP